MGSTQREMSCRPQSAPYLVLLHARARVRESPNGLRQGLELLVTVPLARNRQPPPTVTAGVPHAELAAELMTLPSGLLAMVCEAIVKRKVRLGAACKRACVRACVRACLRACVRFGCMRHRRGPTRSRTRAQCP